MAPDSIQTEKDVSINFFGNMEIITSKGVLREQLGAVFGAPDSQQISKDCGGQFFKVENYLLNNSERFDLKYKYIRIVLKLMYCCLLIIGGKPPLEQQILLLFQ